MVSRDHKLSVRRQCGLLSLARSNLYYQPKGESGENLRFMGIIDRQFLQTPWYGSRQMARFMQREGHKCGRHRVRRLMRLMRLVPIYQTPNTSKKHPQHKVYPFEARNGRLFGFRWKDWGDYKSCLPSGTPSATDQVIGTGDGTTTAFQLVKAYSSGAQSWTRSITKPVSGTVNLALDGIEQAFSWSLDTTTGLVTFTTAPASGVAISAGFEFDVPVRFDTDQLDVTHDIERLGSITSIPLIEVRR